MLVLALVLGAPVDPDVHFGVPVPSMVGLPVFQRAPARFPMLPIQGMPPGGVLIVRGGLAPVDPFEEFRQSLVLNMGAPDFLPSDDPFEAMRGEADGLFRLFGDPLLHSGLGRGFDLSRLPNGTLQIASRLHGLNASTLSVDVDADTRMCIVSGEQSHQGNIGRFQRGFALPTAATILPGNATARFNSTSEVLTVTLPVNGSEVDLDDDSGEDAGIFDEHVLQPARPRRPDPNQVPWETLAHDIQSSINALREKRFHPTANSSTISANSTGRTDTNEHRAAAVAPDWDSASQSVEASDVESALREPFKEYASSQASAEEGVKWGVEWKMGQNGTILQLVARLPPSLHITDEMPAASVEGRVLTVSLAGTFKRTVQLPARLDRESMSVSWDDEEHQLRVSGKLLPAAGVHGEKSTAPVSVPIKIDHRDEL